VTAATAWSRDAIRVTCAASLVIVTALWLSGGGVPALSASPAESVTSVARLSGLLASDLLLIQVFLMARVPLIERTYGQDELARRHRWVGFWSFNLLVLHIALISVGYSLTARTDVVSTLRDLIASYPGVLLAVAGAGALSLVTVSSIRAARRAIRYESWHLLHLYAYLGVGLALPHQLWTGRDFVNSPWATVYWWTAYAVAAGAVLSFRLGLPAWRTLRHGITVTAVTRESHDVITVHLGGRGLHRLRASAGQYFIWRFLDGPGWSRGHPYSLSAAPLPDRVRITAKGVGPDSTRLAALRPGTWVFVEGPYGRLTPARSTGARVALFACGIGITPIRALLEELPFGFGEAVLVHRAHSAEDLTFRAEIDELAQRRGVTVHHLVGPRSIDGVSWLPAGRVADSDTEALAALVPGLPDHDVFVCGPDGWSDALCAGLLAAGVPKDRLHRERFTW